MEEALGLHCLHFGVNYPLTIIERINRCIKTNHPESELEYDSDIKT